MFLTYAWCTEQVLLEPYGAHWCLCKPWDGWICFARYRLSSTLFRYRAPYHGRTTVTGSAGGCRLSGNSRGVGVLSPGLQTRRRRRLQLPLGYEHTETSAVRGRFRARCGGNCQMCIVHSNSVAHHQFWHTLGTLASLGKLHAFSMKRRTRWVDAGGPSRTTSG